MMAASFRKCYGHLILCVFLSLHHGAVASMSPAFVSSASSHHHLTSPFFPPSSRHHNIHKPLSVLSATTPDDNKKAGNNNTSPSARDRGIYARPSAAIERGSGFFIPGLEGSRIRFIFGITVLLADAANHFLVGGRVGDWGQSVAELVSAFYGALLLLQGSIELAVERGYAQGGDDNGGGVSTENEDGAILNKDGGSSRRGADALQGKEVASSMIQRMAQTIITFTPATYFRFVDEDSGVLYSLGAVNDDSVAIDADEQKRLVKLSLDALSESRGGRVALPSEHPASKLLPESATRCILVQKVNGYQGSRGCVIIGSDKLLPSFTKNDLRWIGQLAGYNDLMYEKS
mmetsp:Transcript_25256/g.45433  ORF Transcript_25256/g.45433 Transcript_25256/m.45433 type:complete len:346 (+) Transcript_25256:163-1200(+)